MVLFDLQRLRSNRFIRVLVPDNLITALRRAWVLLVLWGEIGVFVYALLVCRWPKLTQNMAGSRTRPTRILLVADAQVPMPLAHSQTSTELYNDIYTRRAWKVTRHMHPDLVIFLGDMLRTGRFVESDDEFSSYVQHFKDFFPLPQGVKVEYVPGNVDVGLGVSNTFSKHVRQRYERHFGAVNQHLPLANHSLILLDAPGIVDEDYIRAGHGTSFEEWVPLRDGAVEFVKGLSEEDQLRPVILFSHIPLHRAESKTCGPLRERGTIHRGVGHGWQRTLGKHTSSFLLESLRPLVIFSADDRDYCDVTHALPGSENETHEITVKSFSPARHVTQPGFHLLSLYPGPIPTHAHTHCLLPRADGTFTRLYAPAVVLTTIILIFAHMQRARHASRLRLATASPLPSHVDGSQPSPPPLPPLPSPYSASSAYSYSYAYTNTPPSSQRDRPPFGIPKRDSRLALGERRTAGTTRESPPPLDHDEGEQDGVRAHYVYVPPASPLPGDLLARRLSARASTPVAAVAGLPGRAWSFTHTFRFGDQRRHMAVRAPAWWPQRTGTRRKGSQVWGTVGTDLVRVMAPALITWVALAWLYSS